LLQASGFATKEAAKESAKDVIVQKDWKQVTIPEQVKKTLEETTTVGGGQAYPNDIRGVSGLGLGDGIKTHTDKWMVVSRAFPC
jgi:NADH dehydrogenase (ubiquinone) Fe-S protein 6